MDYLLLLASAGLTGSTSIFSGIYNRKSEGLRGATSLFNVIFAFFALLGWGILYLQDPSFEPGVLPYSVGFGLAYCCGCSGCIRALKYGPVSVTTLLIQLSSVATALWGAAFWDAPLTALSLVGLCLVIVSMALCIKGKKEAQTGKMSFSFKWLFFTLLSFCGNGFCYIFQRSQVIAFDGQHGNMTMFFGMIFAVLFVSLIYLKGERGDSRQTIRRAGYLPVITGLCNFGVNLINLYLASVNMAPSLLYPTITVGGLAVTAILSRICFKERLFWWQWVGMILGAVATVLLSLG